VANNYLLVLFRNFTNDSFWAYTGFVLFFGFGAFSAIVGSLISRRINSRKLLLSWITLGVISTALLAVFQGIFLTLLSSILLGFSLGLGFPCCAAFLADCTATEERARVSGIVILLTFIMAFIATAAISILNIGLLAGIIVSLVVRSTSYVALFLDDCKRPIEKEKSWSSIIGDREFAFYLFPWIMFNVTAGIVWWMIPQSSEYAPFVAIGTVLRMVCVAIFGLVSGVVADYFGRKQPIVIGLVMLGTSFLLLGLVPSPPTVLIYLLTSGIAWGSFLAVYLAVPGDLAFSGSKEKYYALGTVLPLIIELGLSNTTSSYVPANELAPILSIILFLSIIPILRARETLSEGKMYERKIKEHVKKVGKLVKESKKNS
jgi:MFS family permease